MEDGGRIVNISSSLVAFTQPGYGVAAYAGSKAALETFTKVRA
jgi:3-oxoacyl-[acyl-carrier protein] reductase